MSSKEEYPEFSVKRSLVLALFLPLGAVLGWLAVQATGGFGGDAIANAEPATLIKADTNTVSPVAAEARRVASETAERVARQVSTDVARNVARDVASKVARESALKAIESAQ